MGCAIIQKVLLLSYELGSKRGREQSSSGKDNIVHAPTGTGTGTGTVTAESQLKRQSKVTPSSFAAERRASSIGRTGADCLFFFFFFFFHFIATTFVVVAIMSSGGSRKGEEFVPFHVSPATSISHDVTYIVLFFLTPPPPSPPLQMESGGSKLMRKSKDNPVLAGGVLGGMSVLGYMLWGLRHRPKNEKLSVYLIHTRLGVQSTVIGALTLAMAYTLFKEQVEPRWGCQKRFFFSF